MADNPFTDYLGDYLGGDDPETLVNDYLGPEFAKFAFPDTEKIVRPGPQHKSAPEEVPGVFQKYIQPAIDLTGRVISAPYHGVQNVIAGAAGAVQGDPLKYFEPTATPDTGIGGQAAAAFGLTPSQFSVPSPYRLAKTGVEALAPGLKEAEARHPYINAATDVLGEFGTQLALDPVLHGMKALGTGAGSIPSTVEALDQSGVMAELSPHIAAGLAGDLAKLKRAGTIFGQTVPESIAPGLQAGLGAAFIPGMAQGAYQGGKAAYEGYQKEGFTPKVFQEGLQAAADTAFAGIGTFHLVQGLRAMVDEGKISPQQAEAVLQNHQAGEVVQDPSVVPEPQPTVPEAFQAPPAEVEAPPEVAAAHVEAPQPVVEPVAPRPAAAPLKAVGQSYDVPAIEQPDFGTGLPGKAPFPPKQRQFEIPGEEVGRFPAEAPPPVELAAPAKEQVQPAEKEKVEAAAPEPVKAEELPTPTWQGDLVKYMEETKGKVQEPAPGEMVSEGPHKATVKGTKVPPVPEGTVAEVVPEQLAAPEKPAHEIAYEKTKDALKQHGRQSPEYAQAHREWMQEEYKRNHPEGEAPVEAPKPEAPKPESKRVPLPAEGEDLKTFGKTRRAEIEEGLKSLAEAKDVKQLYKYAADIGIEGFKTGKRRDGAQRTIESIGRHLGWGEGEGAGVQGFTKTGGGYWEYEEGGAKLRVYPRRSRGGIPAVIEDFTGEAGAAHAAARTALARLQASGDLVGQVKIAINKAEGQKLAKALEEEGLIKPVLKDGKPDIYVSKSGVATQNFEYLGKKEAPIPVADKRVAWKAPAPGPQDARSAKLIDKLKGESKQARDKNLVDTLSRLQRENPAGVDVDIDAGLITPKQLKQLEEAGIAKVLDAEGEAYVLIRTLPRGQSKMIRDEANQWYESIKNQIEVAISNSGENATVRNKVKLGMRKVAENYSSGRPLFEGTTTEGYTNPRDIINKIYFRAPGSESKEAVRQLVATRAFRDFPSLMESINEARRMVGIPESDSPPKFLNAGSFNAVYELDGQWVARISAYPPAPFVEADFMVPVKGQPVNRDGFRMEVLPKLVTPYDNLNFSYERPLGKSMEEFMIDYRDLRDRVENTRGEDGQKLYEDYDIKEPNVAYMPDGRLVVADLGAVAPAKQYRTGRWGTDFDPITRMTREGKPRETGAQEAPVITHLKDGIEHVVKDFAGEGSERPAPAHIVTMLLNERKLFDASKQVWEEMRKIEDNNSLFVGFTPSPSLFGLWHEGSVVFNPLAAIEKGSLAADARRGTAEHIMDTLIHEWIHDKIPEHNELFEERFAEMVTKIKPHEERLLDILLKEDLSPETMASLADAAQEHFYEEPKKAYAGTGERGLAPIKDQPSGSKAGTGRSEAPGNGSVRTLFGSPSRSAREVGAAPGSPERDANLRKWFGRSVVKTSEGKPKVVYHGTPGAGFNEFDPGMRGATNAHPSAGIADWFTDYTDSANQYANQGDFLGLGFSQGVMPVYLKLQSPVVMEGWRYPMHFEVMKIPEIIKRAIKQVNTKDGRLDEAAAMRDVVGYWQKKGHDGLLFKIPANESHPAQEVYGVFDGKNVKSAIGNQGTFDPTNPDIRRSSRPEPSEADIEAASERLISLAEGRRPKKLNLLPKGADEALRREPTADELVDWWDAKPDPKRRVDGTIGKNIARNFPRTELDAEGRARLGPVYEILNKDYSRSKPMHFAEVSEAAKEIFKLRSPEDYLAFVKRRGFALRPEEDHAVRTLVSSRETEILDLTKQMAKDPHNQELELKWDRIQSDFQSAALAMAESGTNLARAMAFRRMLAQKLTPEETAIGRFRTALRQMGIKSDLIPELVRLRAAKDIAFPEALRRALDPTWTDKLLEIWKAGLVSGPATKLANLGSNTLFRGLRDVENLFAVGVDAARAKLTGTKRERYLGEVAFAWHMYGKILGGEEGAIKQWLNGHADILKLKELTKPYAGSKFELEYPGAVGGKLGEFVRAPFKSLEVDDSLFKHLSAGLEVARRSYRRAMRGEGGAGSTVEKATAIYAEMMDVVRHGSESKFWNTKGYDKEFVEIEAQMLRDTFQNPLEKLGQAVMQAQRSSVGAQIILPFIKTPANIAKEALLRTPYGFWKTYRKIKSKELRGGAAAEEFTKPLVGTLLGVSMAMAAKNGLITGGGPGDPKKEENKRATGWLPYSVKIDGVYYPYQRLEPISSILGMAADYAEGVAEWDEMTAGKIAQRIVGSISENITNKTFLSGLESFFTLMHDPLRYGERFIKQLEGSVVPNIIGSVAKGLDPVYRKTEIGLDPLLNKIPGLSQTLPEQTEPTGEPRKRSEESGLMRAISPIQTSREKGPEANVNRELERVDYVPALPRDYITVGGKKVELTDAEKKLLSQARVSATQALLRVIQDPSYRRLPDTPEDSWLKYNRKIKTKQDVLKQVYDKYLTKADDQIRPYATRRAHLRP